MSVNLKFKRSNELKGQSSQGYGTVSFNGLKTIDIVAYLTMRHASVRRHRKIFPIMFALDAKVNFMLVRL